MLSERERMMRRYGPHALMASAFALLAGCSTPNLDDSRAQTLIAMPGPQHYAERRIASDLARRCGRYIYDADLADAMNKARAKAGAAPASTLRGEVDLETNVKQRSLAAYYGQSSYAALDACQTLDQEVARQTPLSILVVEKG